MTTGTLKFVSLLIVIATGGGVAWQAQQGILKQTKNSSKTIDEDAVDESVDLELDLGENSPTLAELPEKESKSSGWNDEDGFSAMQLAAGPGKYERKSKPAKSNGTPIPARKPAANSRTESKLRDSQATTPAAEPEAKTEDPFAEESDGKGSRRPQLTPIPESEPIAEENEEQSLTAKEIQTASANEADSEDKDQSPTDGPVLMVGHSEIKRSKDKKSSRTRAATRDADDLLDPAADPFADSAPPALQDSDAKSEDALSDSIEMPDGTSEDITESFPSLDLPGVSQPSRSRRKSEEPSKNDTNEFGAEPAELTSSPLDRENVEPTEKSEEKVSTEAGSEQLALPTESDPFGNSDPNLMEPSPEADESPPAEKTTLSESFEEIPATGNRSQRAKPRKEHAPVDATPGLLPVPEPSLTDSKRQHPTEDPPEPQLDVPPAPSRRTFHDDLPAGDLEGDAVPDASAPKGVQQPRLTIEKIAPKQAVLRQPLVYSVVIKNTGSADAHHVTVEDRIPKGTTLVGTAPQAELFDKRLVWKLGTLKPDEHKRISIKVIPEQQGQIGSVARVNFVAEIAAEIEVTAPQLVLNVESPSQVRLGDKLHMLFKVRNAGGAEAQNVVIRNLIPDGLRHPAGADLEYAMGTLAAEETREIKLDLIATKNGKVANKTIITGDHGLKVEEETPIEVIGEQLLLTRTGKSKVFVDKSAVFTSTIANEGTAPASRVSVAEVIPAGFEFVSASNKGEFDPATRAVTWTVGPIGPGEELKLSTQLMPKRTGDYRSTITVTGPAGSVATVDAELKVEGHAAVGIDSRVDSRLISVGEKATIRVNCKNQGTALARNLVLTAELPPELKLITGKGQTDWNHEGSTVTFDAIPALQPNETASFELQVEGVAEGDTVIELKFSADHLKRPLQRDETIRVAAGGE